MFIEKYEISIWEDYEKDGLFSERKIATISSDTMTGQMKASSPRITTNINGTKTLSFSLRKNYFDNETGEKVENPFIQYLTNERKIKLYWRNNWYDFLIKEISESSNQSLFEYSCESLYITELGKNGFNLEFDTELENMITGTIKEYELNFDDLKVTEGITSAMNLVARANKYIDETAPWVLAKNNKIDENIKVKSLDDK